MNDETEGVNRRKFLRRSASLIAGGAAALAVPAARAEPSDSPKDPMRVPGALPRPYGDRSPFETAQRSGAGGPGSAHGWGSNAPNNINSTTPLQDLHGIVTPSALHFERHHNGVPAIDPARHRLLIHGLVDRPMVFTLTDLERISSVSRLAFLECSGNSWDCWAEKAPDFTVQELHGLTSTSEWTGVKLSTLLDIVGVQRGAGWMLAEGSDASGLDRSVPLTGDVLEEAMICYGQNGEALRPEQGYPMRLLLPGYEGNINVKWLRRLKFGTAPFMTRWETAKYTDLMPDGTAYQFSLVMEAKSVITSLSGRQQIQPGFHEIRGLAWSGRGRVTKAEVSLDGGRTWQAAQLQEPILPKCHTRFRLPWKWDGQEAILQSRCTDETGYVQPTRQDLVNVRGTNSVYHYNGIQSWKVERDGHVRNISV
ncbi:Oxidoreductase, molybdopterin binding [Nitrospira japonica]|uniref:Oxidoreductase, molybdopterin binding n=1 Tax=Nitrospira japonica TaxID=1325564 RepID=A0A1W1I988_9BACT|nr:sulfite dehydrogenase [Nitrospira japonica]SLM49449.1 Oxidoreductase, molybdopterin binding [Nitrospira japonica]